jgi:hypothetical protein
VTFDQGSDVSCLDGRRESDDAGLVGRDLVCQGVEVGCPDVVGYGERGGNTALVLQFVTQCSETVGVKAQVAFLRARPRKEVVVVGRDSPKAHEGGDAYG